MKKLLKTTAIAMTMSFTATAAYAAELNVVSWGGAYTKSQVEAYYKPYTEMTGTKINSEDYTGGLAEIRAQVEANNVTWDVVDVTMSDAILGCDEGLFEEIDPSILPAAPDGTPASEDFVEGAINECGIGIIVWSTIYAYDKTKFPNGGPTTMADFFDVKKFPGKRSMRKNAQPNLEFALVADGVSVDDVYEVLSTPQGVDRAFAKLDTIKDDIIWWEAGAQPVQLLADGEVSMTTAYNGRIFAAQNVEGKPFEIVWDGQLFDFDLWVIPRGAKNKEEALKFVAFSSDTKRLADQAAYISYGPTRKSSSAMIGKHAETGIDMLPHMPTAPANFKNPILNDFQWWSDYGDEVNERFTAWLAQ